MILGARKAIAAGLATAEMLSFSGCAIEKPAPQIAPKVIQVSAPDEFMKPDVDVLLVGNGVLGGYFSKVEVETELRQAGDALAYSTRGARNIGAISLHEVEAIPQGKKMLWGRLQTCYTDEQYRRFVTTLREERGETGKQAISIVAYSTNLSCDEQGVGGALVDTGDSPSIMLNLQYGVKLNALHEIGHALGPDAIGLGHAALWSCWRYEKDEKGNLVPAFMPSYGSVQALASSGECNLARNGEGEVDWYASKYTVMGNDQRSFGAELRPSFSPPELAQLNPSLRTELIQPTTGKYYLSYADGDLFGLRLQLPADHVLKTQVPRADSVYIGPVITGGSSEKKTRSLDDPRNEVQIMAFAETKAEPGSSNPWHETAVLVPYLHKNIPSIANCPNSQTNDGIDNRVVIYDDEQLDIVVIAGTDEGGHYAQLIRRDDESSLGNIMGNLKSSTDSKREVLLRD